MATVTPILEHAVPFGLVMARVAGLFIAGPVLSNAGIPLKARMLLAVALSAAVYPVVPHSTQSTTTIGFTEILPMMVGESLVGGAMGIIASIPMYAMDMAGTFSGQVMGMGLGRVYNPEMDADFDVLGQFLYIVAGAIFVGVGGIEWLFLSLAKTFATLPPGGIAASDAPLELLLDVLHGGYEMAMRISLPVVGAVGLLAVVLGAIGKTMPQINIMNIGFSIKTFAGLAMLAGAMVAVGHTAGDEIDSVLNQIADWASSLAR